MINRNLMRRMSQIFVVLALMLNCALASAAQIYWTDWTGSNTGRVSGLFQGLGTITTPTSTVNVTYTNPQGIGFYQASGGTDWWDPRTPVGSSPYTSALVDNPPDFNDIVALQYAGNQTLQFSQTIANPVFSYVSLNGNGYAFLNQDFEILSYGGTEATFPVITVVATGGVAPPIRALLTLAVVTSNTNCWAPENLTGLFDSQAHLTP